MHVCNAMQCNAEQEVTGEKEFEVRRQHQCIRLVINSFHSISLHIVPHRSRANTAHAHRSSGYSSSVVSDRPDLLHSETFTKFAYFMHGY
jgi:hypothetical protein